MLVCKVYDENIFWVFFRKHYCPRCGERLKRDYIYEIWPAKSEVAKKYRFSGTIPNSEELDLRTGCFYCEKCKQKISYKEVKTCETQARLRK